MILFHLKFAVVINESDRRLQAMYVTVTYDKRNSFFCVYSRAVEFLPRDAMNKRVHAMPSCGVYMSCSCTVSKQFKIRPQLLWNAKRKPYIRSLSNGTIFNDFE